MVEKGYRQIILERINALAELERIGWDYEPKGNNEVLIRCPFPGHTDKNPSASLNIYKNVWKCYTAGCQGKGDIILLLSLIAKVDIKTIKVDLSTRYNLEVIKVINPEVIDKFHDAIWKAGPLLQELYKRGIGNDLIRKARLGYSKGRITIPIFNEAGQVINLRRYLPGATTKKYTHTPGYKTITFYLPEQLKYDTIWICGGELKALAISPHLNKISIGAVAVTGGEGTWNKELTRKIQNKTVYIVMDIDAPGVKAAKTVASQIKGSVTSVFIITLPLDIQKFPKGDINDWLVYKKPKQEDIKNVINLAEKFEFHYSEFNDTNGQLPVEINLGGAVHPDNVGKLMRLNGIISGIDVIPFMIPKDIKVFCSQDQPNCHKCPVSSFQFAEEGIKLTIKDDSYGILDIFTSPRDKQRNPIKNALGIPYCKTVHFKVSSYYSVYESRLTPQLNLRNENNSDYRVQPGIIVTTKEIELNTPYSLTGKLYPHPKTQQAQLVINKIVPTNDSLNSCTITKNELGLLKIFRPQNWSLEDIKIQLNILYSDLEANVTRIYKRRELHLALDLTWLSPLYFEFDGRQQNGWVNLLIIGDSAQGKTETSLRMMEHYGLGIRHDCKNASVAGLLGGVEQMGQRRFISWGIVPSNDRKLVILEEIKGASKEVISQLTDMRSSGMAEITKIERRKAHARTRLIMVSNPRSDRPMASYNFGLDAIKELIGAPEDIRRYDLAIILSNKDISSFELNKLTSHRPIIDHVYTKELCKLIVLWAWTRKSEQIVFDSGAIEECLDSAIKLCNMFSEEIPLVDRATIRFKIARLSIALAARTFSTDVTLENIVVKKCHVQYITEFLIILYSSSSFGYDNYTKAIEFQNEVVDPIEVTKRILETLHPKDLIDHLLNSTHLTHVDFGDWTELDRDGARTLVSFLVRKHALKRDKMVYHKTIGFIELLRKIKVEKKKELNNEVGIKF